MFKVSDLHSGLRGWLEEDGADPLPVILDLHHPCPAHRRSRNKQRREAGDLSGEFLGGPSVGRRFAHQHVADSCESIRRKIPIFEALGQIRENRVFSPIRIEIRVIRDHTSLLSHFLEGRFTKRRLFRSENGFARIGPLRVASFWQLTAN